MECERMRVRPLLIILSYFLPSVKIPHKTLVKRLFRAPSDLYGILQFFISSKIIPLPLKTNGHPLFPVPCFADSLKTAGIIASVLPFFQPLHTGSVHMMQPLGDFLLVFCLQAAAAFIISINQVPI